jgi:molybdopterin molybdotransferase
VIELDEALAILRDVPVESTVETIPIDDALGRVLAATVRSPIDSPPFDKSAMDGFALAAGDVAAQYRIAETIAAGAAPGRAVGRGECARIMTGAMLPPGADRVIRKEYVEEKQGFIRPRTPEPGDNVIRKGSHLRAGDIVLGPKVLAPQDIGTLAASGIAMIAAAVPPVTRIICTGGEICAPGKTLGPGQIYNSNGPQLRAQLAAMRCASGPYEMVQDAPDALSAALTAALAASDVVLLTGGVSAGDFDYVPGCLEGLGAEILFHGVAVKPGKPVLFARRGNGFIFGLPGNPVSTFVIFEVFVKPFLYRRMGIEWPPPAIRGVVAETISRRLTDRAEFLPVRLRQGMVRQVKFHGSSHQNALAEADGLIRVEKGVAEIAKGTEIDVRPI